MISRNNCRRRGVTTLATAGLLAAAAFVPASAGSSSEREVLASVKDPRGDVRVHHRIRGLSMDERTSIDLRKVTVEARGSGTRFTVQLRDVRRTRGWDQMVFFNISQPAGSDDLFSGSVGFSPQAASLSYAYLNFGTDGTDFESCDPLRAKVSWKRDVVSLDVPRRCLPDSEAVVRVQSLTGYFRSDAAGPWSSDRARFAGAVSLR
ncbi:hypothetical protein [Nocardioides sp. P5_E3]